MADQKENFEQEIEDRIKEYSRAIRVYKEKAESIHPEDEIHELIKELENQHSIMTSNIKKMEDAEHDARSQLKEGIADAIDVFNTVMDKIAKHVNRS